MITLFETIKYVLLDLKHALSFRRFKAIWRSHNGHNLTYPGNEFQESKVTVGNGTYGTLNVVSYENPEERLIIGNYCSIAGNTVFLLSGQHNMQTVSTYPFKKIVLKGGSESGCKGPIIVDDDVWIGYRALILSGVHIGQGAVIAAGAVVCKDVEPYSIVGGVPARKIGNRFDENIAERLKRINFGCFDNDFIKRNITELYNPIKEESDLRLLEEGMLKHGGRKAD